MDKEECSTLILESNLQVTCKERLYEDNKFLESIEDPRALEKIKSFIIRQRYNTSYSLSKEQKMIYEASSEHCKYADEGDFPWGIIQTSEGTFQKVCRCMKTTCEYFNRCRPDVVITTSFQDTNMSDKKPKSSPDAEVSVGSTPNIKVKEITNEAQEVHVISSEKDPKSVADVSDDDNLLKKSSQDSANQDLKIPISEKNSASAMENQKNSDKNVSSHDATKNSRLSIEDDFPEASPAKMDNNKKASENKDMEAVSRISLSTFCNCTQKDYLNLTEKERVLVNAGPGTGKTWALIQKIVQLLRGGEIKADEILVLCFSRAAVSVIERRLKEIAKEYSLDIDWHQIEIRTFDSFATRVLSFAIENYPEYLPSNYQLGKQSFDARIQTVNTILKKCSDLMEECRYFIVDEVQDLVGIRAEMVLNILNILPGICGFSLTGDACQAIYDYNVKDSEMTSCKFYEEIFRMFPHIHYMEFSENYRMKSEDIKIIRPLRQALIQADRNSIKEVSSIIVKELKNLNMNYKQPSTEVIYQLRNEGSLAFLTRSNAQALLLSTYFNNADIHHTLLRQGVESYFASWISDVFMNYYDQTIDENRFMKILQETHPVTDEEQGIQYWRALIDTQRRSGLQEYKVSDILHGILERPYQKCLFTNNSVETDDILISTIHRAKGKEFDAICVPDSIPCGNDEDVLSEGKVMYVALTRGKKQIFLSCFSPRKLYQPSFSQRYCRYRNNSMSGDKLSKVCRSKLNGIEFGLSDDINMNNFATELIQTALLDNQILPGYSLILKKRKLDGDTLVYYIYDADEEYSFGIVGQPFFDSYKKLYRMSLTNKEMVSRDYPEQFTNIFVDSLISCISTDIANKPGAKVFDDICIWKGFTAAGFADMDFGDRH